LGITADFSGAYKEHVNSYTYAVGTSSDRTPPRGTALHTCIVRRHHSHKRAIA
jgi:hypothetical protein